MKNSWSHFYRVIFMHLLTSCFEHGIKIQVFFFNNSFSYFSYILLYKFLILLKTGRHCLSPKQWMCTLQCCDLFVRCFAGYQCLHMGKCVCLYRGIRGQPLPAATFWVTAVPRNMRPKLRKRSYTYKFDIIHIIWFALLCCQFICPLISASCT